MVFMPLYHFTDPRNLDSIREHGLLSWYQLLQRNITHYAGSNEISRQLDKTRNLEDYVRLCLKKFHPMIFAAASRNSGGITWVIVNDCVIARGGTLFSNDNATSNRAVINNNPFTALFSKSDQAEILIKSHIPANLITFPTILKV
jgi:hypothetical protein